MTTHRSLPLLLALAAGCGGDAVAPRQPSAAEMAHRFGLLGDSLAQTGDLQGAMAMDGAATLLQLTGGYSPLELLVDGRPLRLFGVGLQYALPAASCPAGPEAPTGGDADCVPLPASAGRLVVAWDGADVHRMFVVLTDTTGEANVGFEFAEPGDATAAAISVALLLDRRSRHFWYGTGGRVTTHLARDGEACPALAPTPPGVQYGCERARLTAAAAIEATALEDDRGPALHQLGLAETRLQAVAIAVTSLGGRATPSLVPFQPLLQPAIAARQR